MKKYQNPSLKIQHGNSADEKLSKKQKRIIALAVKKVVKEYG